MCAMCLYALTELTTHACPFIVRSMGIGLSDKTYYGKWLSERDGALDYGRIA